MDQPIVQPVWDGSADFSKSQVLQPHPKQYVTPEWGQICPSMQGLNLRYYHYMHTGRLVHPMPKYYEISDGATGWVDKNTPPHRVDWVIVTPKFTGPYSHKSVPDWQFFYCGRNYRYYGETPHLHQSFAAYLIKKDLGFLISEFVTHSGDLSGITSEQYRFYPTVTTPVHREDTTVSDVLESKCPALRSTKWSTSPATILHAPPTRPKETTEKPHKCPACPTNCSCLAAGYESGSDTD